MYIKLKKIKMSKHINDMFEYEKQWQLFKGNEYMFNLLRQMRPKISCKCPKSYLDFQKMSKNTMVGVVKEHDLMLQNKRLKRKLEKIQISKSTISNYIDSYPTIQQMQSHLKNAQNKVSKDLERNHILLENTNMFRRINESKSFFSTIRSYSNINRQHNHRNRHSNSNININSNSHINSNRNSNGCNNNTNEHYKKKRSMNEFRSTSTTAINMKRQTIESLRDTRTHNYSLIDNSIKHAFFDYTELNKELIKKNTFSIELHKKNIYIPNYGLVCVKLNYQFNKLTIIIDSFNTNTQDTHLIIITDCSSLFRLPLVHKSFDELVFSIKYNQEQNAFDLKKSLQEFRYAVDKFTKEKKELLLRRNISVIRKN